MKTLIALILSALTAHAASITLAWERSTDATVTGYKLYYTDLTAPTSFTQDAGNVSQSVVQGLTEGHTYQFYCIAYNSIKTESVPSNVINYTVPTPPMPVFGLSFEAEAGTIIAPFRINGGIIQQDIQTTAPAGGRAFYTFAVTNGGVYTISMTVNGPDNGANSVYVNIDSDPTSEAQAWDFPITTGFEARTVVYSGETNAHSFALTTGQHVLYIRGREAGTQIDRIIITPVVVQPPPPQPPSPPTNLRLTALQGNKRQVSWMLADITCTSIIEQAFEYSGTFKRVANVSPGTLSWIDTKPRQKVTTYRIKDCKELCSTWSEVTYLP